MVTVAFELNNWEKTLSFVKDNIDKFDDEIQEQTNLDEYLRHEIEMLLYSEIERNAIKFSGVEYSFFENVCHYPTPGIACVYTLGDIPSVSCNEFELNCSMSEFIKNIRASLYVYLD